jgi:16S rRNA C1402 (ribose-2'-O) methylase RsmI
MLSIIGTPIGNLEDLSLRAARTLLEADVILAEDTRTVRTLLERAKYMVQSTKYREGILRQAQDDKPTQRDPDLHRDDKSRTDSGLRQNDKHAGMDSKQDQKVETKSSWGVQRLQDQDSGQGQNDHHSSVDSGLRQNDEVKNNPQRIVSYYKEVEFEKLPDIIGWLEAGLHVALVSEAGMPVISDPGHLLVQTAQKYRIPLTVIPGPSSVHTALVASGVKFDHYQFVGFLPKKDKERLKLFEKLQMTQENLGKTKLVFVAFESPERVQDTLTLLYETYPTMKIVLCRELTKKFEEIVFQPSAGVAYRGEIVLILDFGKQV